MGAAPVRRLVKGSRLTAAEHDSNLDAVDQNAPVPLAIISGAITVTGPGTYHITPETGTADVLDTVHGALGREWRIILCTNAVGHVITVTAGTSLKMATPTFLLNSVYDTIIFADPAASVWREIGRTSVPA